MIPQPDKAVTKKRKLQVDSPDDLNVEVSR